MDKSLPYNTENKIDPYLPPIEVKGLVELVKGMKQTELASEYCRRLLEYINEFDKSLDQTKETAIRLVSFGQTFQFTVQQIGFYDPKLICFYGMHADGSPIQLIQHVNQISFLLMSVKRENPELPKQPIGFYLEADEE